MNPESEMVERVAKAIIVGIENATKENHNIVLVAEDDGSALVDGWCDYTRVAKTVLEAMREPIEAMKAAGAPWCEWDQGSRKSDGREEAGDAFRAMISAALTGEVKP